MYLLTGALSLLIRSKARCQDCEKLALLWLIVYLPRRNGNFLFAEVMCSILKGCKDYHNKGAGENNKKRGKISI